MSNIDIISMAVRNLFKRKLRTFLTILGVIVGTAAIVIMISLGIAMNESFSQQLEQMGDITIITVNDPNYWNVGGSSGPNDTTLTKTSAEEFKKIKGVRAVTPLVETNLKFVSGRYVASLMIKGIDASVMEEFNFKLEGGRVLEESDERTLNMVFGFETQYNFEKPSSRNMGYSFSIGRSGKTEEREPPDIDVLNDKIKMSYDYSFGEKNPTNNETSSKKKVKPYNVKGVGLLKGGNWDTDYYAFMSLTQLEKIQAEQEKYEKSMGGGSRGNSNNKKGYQSILVKCNSIDDVKRVQEEIKGMGYEAYSNMDYISSMQEISNSLQALLGAIGAVSLFIAAIGITNTMIMAIYERTREIGIMKVIGAQIKDIKKLFLLEAILIGFLGGVFGIVISLIVSSILNNVQIPFLNMMSYSDGAKISSIPLWLCLSALGFSSFVGLISGYFPARRAMKLSALTAIKTE